MLLRAALGRLCAAPARWNLLRGAPAAPGAFAPAQAAMATHFPGQQEQRIRSVKGDLFSCPATDALAHCISEDCRMGAGIAVLFKKKFGGVQELLAQQKKTGEVAVLRREDRYIYYLITKKKVSHKPTYDSMRQSLEAMKAHCLNNGVTDISMPRPFTTFVAHLWTLSSTEVSW
ncbi:ADP-ribose glycohydrolase OARD1 isoform X2 [Pogoniulus pusillus]|uniref:ADP-ribose glycohydrolase OARD1 isoform X2 n=1 Tax=Pogoniulus pusillus TaxID=488313 RepID=UPI0030B965C4